MTDSAPQEKKNPAVRRRVLRWLAVAAAAAAVLWLTVWLIERSYRSNAKKRAMQSWLDDNLNADVSLLGDMVARLNLVRNSRLIFYNAEVEHPNPLSFSGKLATIERMGAWIPPWSMLHLWPGNIDIGLQGMDLTIEENEAGEWSTDGFMNALASTGAAFPFPVPRVSGWKVDLDDAALTLRRRGYELKMSLEAEIFGTAGDDRVTMRARRMPFTFGRVDGGERLTGNAGAVVAARVIDLRREGPVPVPGQCEMRIESLPAAALPFFFGGMPLAGAQGVFHGDISYQPEDGAAGKIVAEGHMRNADLSAFGLPPDSPVRVTWPVMPVAGDLAAEVHMGPSGFGAFELRMPLDRDGRPRGLVMRGDVAAVDNIPALFSGRSPWPEWLSRTFPSVEWNAGNWLGFGWSGKNMRLNLSRTTAGMNLSGEAELMNGRVRIAMTPDQENTPVRVAAEKLDSQLLAARLSQYFPDAFKVQLAAGSQVNLTWQGLYGGGAGAGGWVTGLVFAKPGIDIAASGLWWRKLPEIAGALAAALPDWGGGDATELEDLSRSGQFSLEQLSVVAEGIPEEKAVAVEFRAYGDSFGQATGMIERHDGQAAEGEFLLAGESPLTEAAARANPDLGRALSLLANDSLGLRVVFRVPPGGEPEFEFPFLDDAKKIHEELRRETGGGEE